MINDTPIKISAAVEGDLDAVVLKRLIEFAGFSPGIIYGKHGKPFIKQHLSGYNQSARFSPWIVLVDLDMDFDCAPLLKEQWLPNSSQFMCFRIVVRSVESWILADNVHLAKFLRISAAKIPSNPETIQNPKKFLTSLAQNSIRKEIREDMVPRQASGRNIGPAYISRLIEFVEAFKYPWRPEIAAKNSDSLNRAISSLTRLKDKLIAHL